MDLTVANEENLQFILTHIGEKKKKKLTVVNTAILDPIDYDLSKYHELKLLYDHIAERDSLSVSEIQAFIEELSSIRK
ncbi:DUF1128 domain-containing protein [Amphibacillus sediminis]|uniref:DUF1128 domain-containing protein n=1 Tax=Amphibacillus sediminis TaxID=360185 RepID=UPI0008327105|nr:DUF1128 family protein [Amphibacillus sediminis]